MEGIVKSMQRRGWEDHLKETQDARRSFADVWGKQGLECRVTPKKGDTKRSFADVWAFEALVVPFLEGGRMQRSDGGFPTRKEIQACELMGGC